MAKADKLLYGEGFFKESLSPATSLMHNKYVVPPFSVLDARQGSWIKRKRAWLDAGLAPRAGRYDPDDVTKIRNRLPGTSYAADLAGFGGGLRKQYDSREHGENVDPLKAEETGVSGFDPVLAETIYSWFCPRNGSIFDPFAGEATKGIVATVLGYDYLGIELRQDQIDVNYEQADIFSIVPRWIQGDSIRVEDYLDEGDMYDFIFTSPPYASLQVYSDLAEDGSTFNYEDFMEWYQEIFRQSIAHLKDDRFLCVKIGEVRDEKTGMYLNFVGDNIKCFTDLGLFYFNELILVTRTGSLPLRAGRIFDVGRKIGRGHQTLQVYWKGDPKNMKETIKEYYGAVGDLSE